MIDLPAGGDSMSKNDWFASWRHQYVREWLICQLKASVCERMITLPAGGDQDAEPGARLSCHLLLRLFKPSLLTSEQSAGPYTTKIVPMVQEACDRQLLAASHSDVAIGPLSAILKAMLILGRYWSAAVGMCKHLMGVMAWICNLYVTLLCHYELRKAARWCLLQEVVKNMLFVVGVPELKPWGSPSIRCGSRVCGSFPTPVHAVRHTIKALPAFKQLPFDSGREDFSDVLLRLWGLHGLKVILT